MLLNYLETLSNSYIGNLEDESDKLVKWSEKWQMSLDFDKRKYLHLGHKNACLTCIMSNV